MSPPGDAGRLGPSRPSHRVPADAEIADVDAGGGLTDAGGVNRGAGTVERALDRLHRSSERPCASEGDGARPFGVVQRSGRMRKLGVTALAGEEVCELGRFEADLSRSGGRKGVGEAMAARLGRNVVDATGGGHWGWGPLSWPESGPPMTIDVDHHRTLFSGS